MNLTAPENGVSASPKRLNGSVIAALFCRILLNTARRFAYPFAPILSRGMDVPLTAVTSLIAVNQATGLLGILFGPLADRWGYRLIMMIAMVMLSLGMLMAGWVPLYGVVLAGLILAGLAKNVFDPAVQAFVGERITFRRRARVIGILEFSWAGSTLLGVPVVGILIDRFGWRSPFFVLGGMGILGLLVLGWTISGYQQTDGALRSRDGIWRSWRKLIRQPRALTAMAFGFLLSAANDNLFVVYGAWLESSFQLGVVALGFGTAFIGVAEFLGEVSTAAWADRLGLKASVITGLTLSILSYLMLPLISHNLTLAFFALFVVFIVFEFTVVAFLSLCTELVPEMRATMMSMLLAAAGMGRMVGALMGGPVWLAGGIAATAAVSALTSALALACLIWGLRDWRPQ